ncbi:hypothetical protein [Planococcus sp. SSTMD024]|uniref:hypothetical protein n=1 Tax=Planococcus sp. SSTMD024 TaxID=3242163 RepID=UPI00351F0249
MNTITKTIIAGSAILLLAGCGDEANDVPEENAVNEQAAENTTEKEDSTPVTEEQEGTQATEPEEPAAEQDQGALSSYSSEQIEYARVWLQLGPNQDIDGLYVKKIPAGTPLNPDDGTSGAYPEDVTQLAGSRLVDGVVTYSGNGDGTVNVYNVPLRWDGEYPAGEEFYAELIDNTELVAIEAGEDEDVIRLIELLKMEP